MTKKRELPAKSRSGPATHNSSATLNKRLVMRPAGEAGEPDERSNSGFAMTGE